MVLSAVFWVILRLYMPVPAGSELRVRAIVYCGARILAYRFPPVFQTAQ